MPERFADYTLELGTPRCGVDFGDFGDVDEAGGGGAPASGIRSQTTSSSPR